MIETEIISKVRSIMNEIGDEDSLTLLSEDTVKLDEYIKSVIPDAVNIVIENCPSRCVNRKSPTVSITNGSISLPSDFVRLVSLQLTGWKRAVTKSYPIGSEEYKVQANEFTTAGVHNPVAISSYKAGPILLCYPIESSVDSFVYEAAYNSTDGLSLLSSSDPVAISVCYMCASLVYMIFENAASAKNMRDQALDLLTQQQNGI